MNTSESHKNYEKKIIPFTISLLFYTDQVFEPRWGTRQKARGMVKNLPLLRRASNNGRSWVHAVMCDNTYSDICMMIHASTL